MKYFSVGDVASDIGCRPRDVSDAFYQGRLDESRVIRVAGRRGIPADYLAEIRQVLVDGGNPEPEADQ